MLVATPWWLLSHVCTRTKAVENVSSEDAGVGDEEPGPDGFWKMWSSATYANMLCGHDGNKGPLNYRVNLNQVHAMSFSRIGGAPSPPLGNGFRQLNNVRPQRRLAPVRVW